MATSTGMAFWMDCGVSELAEYVEEVNLLSRCAGTG